MPDAGAYDRVFAVVQSELRALARQKTPFVLRTVYAAMVAAGVVTAGFTLLRLFAAQGWSGESMAALGGRVFAYVVVIQATLAAVLGVLLGVAAIHAERQNKTLGLLVLSQLRSGEIVYGKFLAVFGLVFTVLLAGLPVFALLGWVGGVDYRWLGALAFYTLALAALGAATGLHFGLRIHGAAGAATAGLCVMAVPAVSALPFWTPDSGCIGCLAGILWIPASVALGASSIAQQATSGGASVFLGLGMSLAFTWLQLVTSATILPTAASAAPGLGLRGIFEDLDKFYEEINLGGIRFELGASKGPRGNPVTWLTRTSSGLGLPHYSFRLMAFAVLISLFGIAFASEGGAFSQLLGGFWILTAIGVPITAGANAFGDEKVRKTLGVLLATPLTAWGLLRGKLFVFFRLLVMLIVPTVVILMFMDQIDPRLADAIRPTIVLFGAEAVLAYGVALFLSLVLASPLRAGVATVTLLAFVHLLYGAVGIAAAGSRLNHAALRLVPWVLAAGAVVWAIRNARPAIGLAVSMAALAPLLALDLPVPAFAGVDGYLARAAEVGTLAAFVLVYTVLFFDRAVGRTR